MGKSLSLKRKDGCTRRGLFISLACAQFLSVQCCVEAGPLQRLKRLLVGEKSEKLPQSQPGVSLSIKNEKGVISRFAIDSAAFFPLLEAVTALGDGLSEIQGVGFSQWGVIEPRAPINGSPQYRSLNDLRPQQRKFLAEYDKTGRELSVALEFYDNDWAFEFSDIIKVQSPRNGTQIPAFVRIKKEHELDFKNFIKFYVSKLPNLKYIQIDNEPENVWACGKGYVRALQLAYEAIQEYNAANATEIKVMAAGFYLGPQLISVSEQLKAYAQANYPDIDESWLRRELKLPQDIDARKLRHAAQKLHVVMSVLQQEKPAFDILSLHLDGTRPYDNAEMVAKWYQQQMKNRGYQRPIWVDDMHSGYYPEPGPENSESEKAFFSSLSNNQPDAIASLMREQPKWLVRKAVGYFAAGFERLKIAQLVDMPDYFMPQWRFAGLFTIDLSPKPVYYAVQQLIGKLDGFASAAKLHSYLYRFSFPQKNDVFVAWSESGAKTLDLSQQLGSARAEITFLINSIDADGSPIVKESLQVDSQLIPLGEEPIYIEAFSR